MNFVDLDDGALKQLCPLFITYNFKEKTLTKSRSKKSTNHRDTITYLVAPGRLKVQSVTESHLFTGLGALLQHCEAGLCNG